MFPLVDLNIASLPFQPCAFPRSRLILPGTIHRDDPVLSSVSSNQFLHITSCGNAEVSILHSLQQGEYLLCLAVTRAKQPEGGEGCNEALVEDEALEPLDIFDVREQSKDDLMRAQVIEIVTMGTVWELEVEDIYIKVEVDAGFTSGSLVPKSIHACLSTEGKFVSSKCFGS